MTVFISPVDHRADGGSIGIFTSPPMTGPSCGCGRGIGWTPAGPSAAGPRR
jgi:hypothetical protein